MNTGILQSVPQETQAPLTLRTALSQRVLDQWKKDGYGVLGAIADGSRLYLPLHRSQGAELVREPFHVVLFHDRIGAFNATSTDKDVLDALAYIRAEDDEYRITGDFPGVEWQREQDHGDGTQDAKLYVLQRNFDLFCKSIYDLWLCAQEAVRYADGYGLWDARNKAGAL